MQIRIDTRHLQHLSEKLKSLSKSAFPVAIRKTLNDTAYDVKQKSMPKQTSKTFKKRAPTFFSANSKVVSAQGFNVNAMKADVGFFSNKLSGNNNRAVKDLEEQEHGGLIDHKEFIAEDGARKVAGGLVKPNRRLGKLPSLSGKVAVASSKGMVCGKLRTIKSKRQMFIRAAFLAKKKFGGYMLGNKGNRGSRTLSIISSISNSGGKVTFKRSPLYNVNKGRAVKVNATNFMKRASHESSLEMNRFFIANAQLQFKKHLTR